MASGVRAFAMRLVDPTIHECSPPAPALMPHVEGVHTVSWNPLGAKVADSVHFDGACAVQQGHDSGPPIIHYTATVTPMLAVVILTAKYKFHFGAARVRVGGKPAAGFIRVTAPPLACASPISMPSLVGILPQTTVSIGLTGRDLLVGWGRIGIDMVVDLIWSGLGKTNKGSWQGVSGTEWLKDFSKPWARSLARGIGNAVLRTFLETLMGKLGSDIFKRLLGLWLKNKYELPMQLGSIDFNTGEVRILTWKGNSRWLVDDGWSWLPRTLDDYQNDGVDVAGDVPHAH